MDKKRERALLAGQTQYNGTECRTCGKTRRFTKSTACVACSREHNKRSRDKIRAMFAAGVAAREAANGAN
jgi:hypothetical protein